MALITPEITPTITGAWSKCPGYSPPGGFTTPIIIISIINHQGRKNNLPDPGFFKTPGENNS
jgi:hypothetical protein